MLFRLPLALSLVLMAVKATDNVNAVIGDRKLCRYSLLSLLTALGVVFYFTPGLGACGFTNTSSQYVATVSRTFFDSFP